MNLKELLENWEDQDVSAYYLACCLGFVDYDDTSAIFQEVKWIFWSGNPTGDFLYNTLREMLEIGMLEFNEDDKYRWNKGFEPKIKSEK